MATRLTGWKAIALAEREGALLSKHADDAGPACDGLKPDEARAVAALRPESVYVDVDEVEAPSDGGAGIA